MRFSEKQTSEFQETIEKLQRFMAYKYQCQKAKVALVIEGKTVAVLIAGKLKEKFVAGTIHDFVISETQADVVRGAGDLHPNHTAL